MHCGKALEIDKCLASSIRKEGECSKCLKIAENLLCSSECRGRQTADGGHIFCQSCFEINNPISSPCGFTCPCCSAIFSDYAMSLEEAILIEKGTYASYEAQYQSMTEALVHSFREQAVALYGKALLINPSNYTVVNYLMITCQRCVSYFKNSNLSHSFIEAPGSERKYTQKLHNTCLNMLDLCFDIGGSPCFDQRKRCSLILGNIFLSVSNYPAAVKYLKLAYESCIRSADYTELEMYKREFLSAKEIRAQEPALRFTVGDEVEFLHELETWIKSEWMLGKV